MPPSSSYSMFEAAPVSPWYSIVSKLICSYVNRRKVFSIKFQVLHFKEDKLQAFCVQASSIDPSSFFFLFTKMMNYHLKPVITTGFKMSYHRLILKGCCYHKPYLSDNSILSNVYICFNTVFHRSREKTDRFVLQQNGSQTAKGLAALP